MPPQELGLFLFSGCNICVALNKEKDFASIRHLVTMRTIRTMNTTAGFFINRGAQNLRRIKQRIVHCYILAMSNDVDDQDDDLITPMNFKIFVLKCNHPKQVHPLKPVCRFVSFFERNRKSTSLRAFRA